MSRRIAAQHREEAARALALGDRKAGEIALHLLARRARRIEVGARRLLGDTGHEGAHVVEPVPRPLVAEEVDEAGPPERRPVLDEPEQQVVVPRPDLAQEHGVQDPGRLDEPGERQPLGRGQPGQVDAELDGRILRLEARERRRVGQRAVGPRGRSRRREGGQEERREGVARGHVVYFWAESPLPFSTSTTGGA